MLSDRERATWNEMQDQLLAEDPVFVRAFDAPVQGLPSTPSGSISGPRTYRILVWAAAGLGVLLVLASSLGGALLIAMVGLAP